MPKSVKPFSIQSVKPTTLHFAPFVRLTSGFEELGQRLTYAFAPLTEQPVRWPAFKFDTAYIADQRCTFSAPLTSLCRPTAACDVDFMCRQLATALAECEARDAQRRAEREQEFDVLIEKLGEAVADGLKKSLASRP